MRRRKTYADNQKSAERMRYGLEGRQPMTQKEVAKVFKISRSYVSRIETKVLEKLKKHMMKEKIFL